MGAAVTLQPAGVNVIGSQYVGLRCLSASGGSAFKVQASSKLPYPAAIVSIQWSLSQGASSSNSWGADLYLSEDNSTVVSPVTGVQLTKHVLAGASPPDTANELVETLQAWVGNTLYTMAPLWIPTPGPASYLKVRLWSSVASQALFYAYVTLAILDRPIDVLSRGVESRVRPGDVVAPEPPPSVIVPDVAAPLVAPPTELELAAGGLRVDPLADPLPAPCDVDPYMPLSAVFELCSTR